MNMNTFNKHNNDLTGSRSKTRTAPHTAGRYNNMSAL